MIAYSEQKVSPMTRLLLNHSVQIQPFDRRGILAAGGCALATLILSPSIGFAQDKTAVPESWEVAIRAVTGGGVLVNGRMAFDVPEIAENGNVIPFSLAVESPMTEQDHVRAVHIFATGNPVPLIATFRFNLEAGRAAVTSRMRLAKTQDVIAVAELGNSTFYGARKTIKVTIGGCGG